jgi:hypothetical protein
VESFAKGFDLLRRRSLFAAHPTSFCCSMFQQMLLRVHNCVCRWIAAVRFNGTWILLPSNSTERTFAVWMAPFCQTQLLSAEHALQCYHLKDKKLMILSISHSKLVACNADGSEVIVYLYQLLSFRTRRIPSTYVVLPFCCVTKSKISYQCVCLPWSRHSRILWGE